MSKKIIFFRKKLHPCTHLDSCYFFHAYCYVVMSGSHWVRKFGINFIIDKKTGLKRAHSTPHQLKSHPRLSSQANQRSQVLIVGVIWGHLRSDPHTIWSREKVYPLQSVQIQIYPVIVAMAIYNLLLYECARARSFPKINQSVIFLPFWCFVILELKLIIYDVAARYSSIELKII